MDSLQLAHWQFGITTAYHFVFLPLTVGTAVLTAVLQTMWLCSGRERHLLAAKFWGDLSLIAFALGSAAGIVQEFQLGMASSEHLRFVGDGLGAEPATGGLPAFFLEATLLGLWIVGWDRLPRGVHTACIWLAASGITLSAYLTEAAGSRLTAFALTVAAALLIAGALLVAGSAWHLRRDQYRETMQSSLRVGLCSTLAGGAATAWILTGGRHRPWATHRMPDAARAYSHGVGADGSWTLPAVLTLLYALPAVVEVWLILRTARRGPAAPRAWDGEAGGPEPELGFAY